MEGGEPAGNRRGSSAFSMGLGRSRRDTSGYHLSAEDGGPQADEWEYMSPSRSHASARARQEPSTPARNIFDLTSAFARPDTQVFRSTRRTSQRNTTPARDPEHGWTSPFSPHSRRSTENLSRSSQQAVQTPTAVVQSIGTQRLMPSRDPMAPFHSAPTPRAEKIPPTATKRPTIPRNEDEVKRAFWYPKEPWKKIRDASPVPALEDPERQRWKSWTPKYVPKVSKKIPDKGLVRVPPPFKPWNSYMPVPNREERKTIPTKMRRQFRAWQQAHDEHERLAREKRDREIKEAKAENRRIEREWKANGGKRSPKENTSGSVSPAGMSPAHDPTARASPARNFPAGDPSPRSSLTHQFPTLESRRSRASSMSPAPCTPTTIMRSSSMPLIVQQPSSMAPSSSPSTSMPPPPLPARLSESKQPAKKDADGSSRVSAQTPQAGAHRTMQYNLPSGIQAPFPWQRNSASGSVTAQPSLGTSSGGKRKGDNSLLPPSPKKHKDEKSESEQEMDGTSSGSGGYSDLPVPSIERASVPSSPEQPSQLDDDIIDQLFPPRARITERHSAPPELPPARVSRLLDECTARRSAPQDLSPARHATLLDYAHALVDQYELSQTVLVPPVLSAQQAHQAVDQAATLWSPLERRWSELPDMPDREDEDIREMMRRRSV